MKPPLIIFLAALAMAAAVLVAMAIGETPVNVETVGVGYGGQTVEVRTPLGHGIEHPEFSTMQVGASGEARHARILWVGWFFGGCQIVLFVAALALGMRKEHGLGPVRAPLIAGGAVFAIIFTLLVLSYRDYMHGVDAELVLGFPIPTAWMVFGIWFFPVFFVVLYLRAFDTWYLTDADRARFDALLADAKRDAHGGPSGN
jgi:hypothetical protein